MKRVIHRRVRSGQRVSSLDCVEHRLPLSLKDKIKDGCCTAAGGRTGSRVIVVCGNGSAKRHSQMGMSVNCAGEHKLSLCVDNLCIFLRFKIRADSCNFSILYGYVGFKAGLCCYHRAAFD